MSLKRMQVFCPTEEIWNEVKRSAEKAGYKYDDNMRFKYNYLAICKKSKNVAGNSFERTDSWYENVSYKEFLKMLPQTRFYIDSINREIQKSILEHGKKNGFKICDGLSLGFYRYLTVDLEREKIIGDLDKPKEFDDNSKSINEFFAMEFVKPIMIGNNKVVRTDTGIKVGCTEVSLEQIEAIYKLVKS